MSWISLSFLSVLAVRMQTEENLLEVCIFHGTSPVSSLPSESPKNCLVQKPLKYIWGPSSVFGQPVNPLNTFKMTQKQTACLAMLMDLAI